MTTNQRRDFLKTAGTTAAGLAAGALAGENHRAQAAPLNPAAKAVLPDGSIVDRAKILETLGLDPGTHPDAWLTIIGCGSNASALKPGDAKILIERNAIDKSILSPVQIKQIKQIRLN
jgi:TAT (twin-arginine translocation) pathway signal sequence